MKLVLPRFGGASIALREEEWLMPRRSDAYLPAFREQLIALARVGPSTANYLLITPVSTCPTFRGGRQEQGGARE